MINNSEKAVHIAPIQLPIFPFNRFKRSHNFANVARQRNNTYSRVAAVALAICLISKCLNIYKFYWETRKIILKKIRYQIKDVVVSQDIITFQSKTIMSFGELKYRIK